MYFCSVNRATGLEMKILKIILLILLVLNFTSLFAASGLKTEIISYLEQQNIPPQVIVFISAMLPIIELRGAIPIGVASFDLPVYQTFILAVIGNMLPIFFILLFFDFANKLLMKTKFGKKLLEKIFERTRKKGKLIQKYEELGLIFFVAIPLPITGAWTGALAAYLFGLKFWKSIFAIFLGVLCAGVIVTILTVLGKIGALIAVFALALVLLIPLLKGKK